LRELGIFTAFLALGCSSSVELSAPPHLTASSDPTVLAVINERVTALAVDDRRVYWLGSLDGIGSVDGYVGFQDDTLHSCEKNNCVDSLVTYGNPGTASRAWIGLAGGQVYWFEIAPPPPLVTPITEGPDVVYALNACDVSGCSSGVRVVASNLLDIEAAAFSSDHAYVVASHGDVLRIALTGNDAQPEHLFETDVLGAASLAVRGDYLYWLRPAEQNGATATAQRARADGSGKVETVADHLGIGDGFASLAVNESHLYWSDDLLSGSIFSCPLAGCAGEPELLVGPIRLPTTLLIDGANLYWQQETTTSGAVISGCALMSCAPSEPLARGLDHRFPLASDDEYLYTASTSQMLDPRGDWPNPSASIRRIRK
jgi:hypothetical protein